MSRDARYLSQLQLRLDGSAWVMALTNGALGISAAYVQGLCGGALMPGAQDVRVARKG